VRVDALDTTSAAAVCRRLARVPSLPLGRHSHHLAFDHVRQRHRSSMHLCSWGRADLPDAPHALYDRVKVIVKSMFVSQYR